MSKNYIDLSDENFDEELALTGKLILVDFWNEACIPCKRMAPMLERLATEYEDKLTLAKVNADRNPKTIKKYNIKGLPTLVFVKNGKVVERISGVRTKSELIEIIEQNP